MLKSIIKNIFYIGLVILTSISCINTSNKNTEKIIFSYDPISSSLVDTIFKYDSLFFEKTKDSITITRYLGGQGYYYYSEFYLQNNIFYELRISPHIIEEEKEDSNTVISIPMFSIKDTIFDYFPEKDFLPAFVMDLSFNRCNYRMMKNDDEFITIKQSLVDTTYKEIYFYDKNYNLYKYINTWKDNKCVYVKRNY
jgi:hypothetical protein